MTHAELLRSHADLAIKEGGMYYSGEYLSRIATVAESLEAENAELRELVKDLHALAGDALPERKSDYITICSVESCIDYYSRTMPAIERRMRELGVEVD